MTSTFGEFPLPYRCQYRQSLLAWASRSGLSAATSPQAILEGTPPRSDARNGLVLRVLELEASLANNGVAVEIN